MVYSPAGMGHTASQRMTDSQLTPPNDPREAAAWWFARECAGTLTVAQQTALQAWREENPLHDQEYRAVARVWQWADAVPTSQLRALAQAPDTGSRRLLGSRRTFAMAGGAACAILAFGAGALLYNNWYDGKKIELATAHGERRIETLPDGTRLDLNTNTLLTYRVRNGKRVVELAHGDVMFNVVHDRQHPFYVITAAGTVKVLGTRFNVRVEKPLDVRVAVESGVVSVRAEATPTARSVRLTAAMSTRITEAGVGRPAQVDVGELTAWRTGKVVFRNQPLVSVINEMNRYLPVSISIADSSLERLPVAGVFNVDDGRAFLEALPKSLPLRVVRSDRGDVRLFMR